MDDLYEIYGRLLNEDELKRLQGLQKSLLSLSGHIFFEIKHFLEKVYPGKVSYIGAPCEADHQLAALFHQRIIDYVYSIDIDLSVLGCNTIENVCYSKEKKKHACWFSKYQGLVESILPKAFKVKRKFSNEFMFNIACFLGNDFLPHSYGNGEKRATEFMNQI